MYVLVFGCVISATKVVRVVSRISSCVFVVVFVVSFFICCVWYLWMYVLLLLLLKLLLLFVDVLMVLFCCDVKVLVLLNDVVNFFGFVGLGLGLMFFNCVCVLFYFVFVFMCEGVVCVNELLFIRCGVAFERRLRVARFVSFYNLII